ncbi:MAG: PhzF family phenazine biosynthesis protein [Gammaproteobacteria bacterium]
MRIPLFQVDAFSQRVFHGNPAAVCPLEHWLAEDVMQAIAAENNLAETAFVVSEADGWRIRWFTPVCEVDLCGHATLAAAWVLFAEHLGDADSVTFQSRSGPLTVRREASGRLALDFPALHGEPCEPPAALTAGLGAIPGEVHAAMDYLAVFDTESEIRELTPDFAALSALDRRGVIVTAPGTDIDFVSRFFAPSAGIPEDPVTGSAHSMLVPYWAKRLGKSFLVAEQLSARGGTLYCENRGPRVIIAGDACLYMSGYIDI